MARWQSLIVRQVRALLSFPEPLVAHATCACTGQFLQQRTYQGLELRLGEDGPSVLEQGRSGIARGYQDDRSHQDIDTS